MNTNYIEKPLCIIMNVIIPTEIKTILSPI